MQRMQKELMDAISDADKSEGSGARGFAGS